jgi:phage antirepressor YoqD-like protein
MGSYLYTLYDAKKLAFFPGETSEFARFLRKKGYLINRNRAYDEYIKNGWFTYRNGKLKTKKKGVIDAQILFVTVRGIRLLQWLVANHIEEIKETRKQRKDAKRKRKARRKDRRRNM